MLYMYSMEGVFPAKVLTQKQTRLEWKQTN